MKKRLLGLLLALAMVMSLVPFALATDGETPISISSVEDLQKIGNDEDYPVSGNYVLTTDLNLSTVSSWTPIGTSEAPFTGTFDGQGYTISNLTINNSELEYAGLFGCLSTPGVLKNIVLENVTITARAQVGALAGSAHTGTVQNCTVQGTINITGNYKVGGLAGEGYATMENCHVIGDAGSSVTGVHQKADLEGDNVAGLVGYRGEGNIVTTNCTVSGLTVTGTRKVGGLIGTFYMDNTLSGCAVSDVTVATNATIDYAKSNSTTLCVGGLFGILTKNGNNGGEVENCIVENVSLVNTNNVDQARLGYVSGGVRDNSWTISSNKFPVPQSDELTISNVYALGTNTGSNVPTSQSDTTGALGGTATTLDDDDVARVNGAVYDDLQDAIDAAPENGTVVLLQDVTNDNVGISAQSDTVLAINKTITIQGNGNSISVDLSVPSRFGDRDQIFSIGETKTSTAVVTLDNVTMNLTGKEGGKGDIFDMWSTLNITNGSNITISNAQSAFTMQGGMNAKVNLNASAVTANTINGNFSNGGVWDIESGSVLDINGCGTHGLSVEEVTIANSTVTVDGTGYIAIYGSNVELLNGANVIVTNSATSKALASTDYADRGAVQLKNGTGTLTMTNSTLSLSGNGNGATEGEQSIYIGSGNLANTNSIITGTLVLAEGTSSHVVTFMSEGQQYTAHVVTDSVTMPTAPARPGYAFLGWSDGSRTYQPGETATISGNTTFTALWQYIPPADPSYQITIPATANGTVTVSPTSAKEDQVVTITVTPNSGYELTALTVTDRSGNRVTVTANPDGTYRFVMPASQVTVSAAFAPAQLPFTDVTEANWYYDEVYYVWANGLMQGTSATTFGPNVDTTRAMVVTILWRLEGEPASGYDMDYSDVAGGAWYAGAVRWATEHGIVNGSEGQFYPGGTVTREQLAAMLYRYAQYKGYDLTAGGDLSGFADAGAVSGWAETSLAWAVGQRLIQGSANQIDPTGSAIRAQLAAILMRFCENLAA